MSYNHDNIEEVDGVAHTYSGEAFDKFVKESQDFINDLTNENNGLKEQLAQEQQKRLESEDSVANSVRILSTAERVASEYIAENRVKSDAELAEAHEYSQKTYSDADAYSVQTREEADAYHASIVSKAKDDLAIIVDKVNEKIHTYNEVTERLVAFHQASLASLVGPLEDVALLQDEVTEKVWEDAAVIYADYQKEADTNVDSNEDSEISTDVAEESEVTETDSVEADEDDIEAVEPAWEADDSEVAVESEALGEEVAEEIEVDSEVGILELDFEDDASEDVEANTEEDAVSLGDDVESENNADNDAYLTLDLSDVDDDEERK